MTYNVTVNPEAKEQLLQGKINTFNCSKCGLDIFIETELLYHDMQLDFCAKYFPFRSIENGECLGQFGSDAKYGCTSSLSTEYVPEYFKDIHIVFSPDELIKYVIFRDKLAERKAGGEISK